MKPGYVRNRIESKRVGEMVAQLVKDLGVTDKVLLSSFDPFKVLAAKEKNPSLAVGIFYKKGMWDDPSSVATMKAEYRDLPGMRECVDKAPNGTKFMDFLFQSGDLLKSTNSSYVVMDYNIFDNPKYSNNTFQTFADNYSPALSFGAFIIDNLALTDEERKQAEPKLDLLIGQNVSALVTDDIPRLLKKLGRTEDKPTPKASASKTLPSVVVLFAMSLFGWFLC